MYSTQLTHKCHLNRGGSGARSILHLLTGEITVNDMYGKTIANYKLLEGENTLEIINNNWAPGIYTYAMFANGKLIEVKKMVITHN